MKFIFFSYYIQASIESRFVDLVKQPDLDLYVTWAALENALKGLKEAIDSSKQQMPPSPPQLPTQPQSLPTVQTNQAYTQTTSPLPPKQLKKSPPSTPQNPTKELEELLSKLGTLNERHEHLKEEVDKLRDELAKRPTTGGAFKLPDDFAQRLDEIKLIKAALEELKNNLNGESSKRLQLESVIANINHEIENMKNVLKELLKSAELNRDEIAVSSFFFLK